MRNKVILLQFIESLTAVLIVDDLLLVRNIS